MSRWCLPRQQFGAPVAGIPEVCLYLTCESKPREEFPGPFHVSLEEK